MNKIIVAVLLSLSLSAPAFAATQRVTLSVPGMTCGACPITVRTALKRVLGVEHVAIAEAKKEVVVTFDNAKTNPQVLMRATRDAGYASHVVKRGA
ncbi:Mercuric transport protein periplasmic component [mine drainage metagenome]|uniref:Mercuric transport protein periplasmic component n=1 Tax=mine drainage metagenome TaxID=410659 RepID=T0Z5E0_9ZZZZ